MRWPLRLRALIIWLFHRKGVENDLEAELRNHIEQEIESAIQAGVSPSEARMAAQRLFGSISLYKEECRDARGTLWFDDLVRDCRYGVRVLGRSPVFTSVAILSLALGIGAGTAIFSLMDRVMFRMMPVRQPESLIQITRFHPPYGPTKVSYPLFQEFGANLKSLDGLLAHYTLGERDITISGNPEPARFDLVSGSYFRELGVSAVAGRVFDDEVDRRPGACPVAVISYRYWARRFGSNPAAIGATFRRLGTLFTIIGVAPRGFFGTVVGENPDITVPLAMDAQVRGGESWLHERDYNFLSVMGRLKAGWNIDQAGAEVKKVFANVAADDARKATSDRDRRAKLTEYVEVRPAGNGFDDLQKRFSQPLIILMAAVAIVLLLACANLANLLLARAASRQREIGVRMAVGASRGRVVRQLLVEGLLLALGGGGLGVFLAYLFGEGLIRMLSNGGPRMLLDIHPDGRVLLFALAISLIACILFSLTPALHATRPIRAGQWRLGKALIVAQMAFSVILLIAAGLFGRTLLNIYTLDPGFDRHGVTLFSTNAARLGYKRERIDRIQNRLPAELEKLAGIQSASISMFPPISGGGWDGAFLVEGHGRAENNDTAHINSVGINFFKTFGTPVIAGREFDRRDNADSPRVAIVNESFAASEFRGGSPIGKWVAFPHEPDTHYEIVGMVKDVKYESLRHSFPPTVYMMSAQVPPGPDSYTFAIRSQRDLASTVTAVSETLRHVDSTLRATEVETLEEHIAQSLLRERMLAALAGFFGVQALLLSAIGIYGVMVFQVARRRREIGIRIALGADPGTVIGMVLGQTAKLTFAGAVVGVAVGLVLTRATQDLLYGVSPDDPVTLIASTAALLAIALASASIPGMRAARTNPVDTLRVE